MSNLWAFYQKYLVFEDPVQKWLHITKSASQNHHVDFLAKSESFNRNQNNTQEAISTNLVNVLLAYEEAINFQTNAIHQLSGLNLQKYLPLDRIDYWQKIAKVDAYLAQWMTWAELYWPDRTVIMNLNEQDSRLDFLKYCQQKFENKKHNWHQSIQLFRQYLQSYRNQLPTNFLPTAIIIVEGLTELTLLPCFAASYGLDLSSNGVMVIPAGGANKLVRKYNQWKEKVKLPIFCLFDADAKDLANTMLPHIRQSDRVYILSDGEIEDLLQLDFLVEKVNDYLAEDPLFDKNKSVSAADFIDGSRRTLMLDKIWRQRELGKFEKVKFAQFVVDRVSKSDSQFLSVGGNKMLDELAKSIGVNK